MDAVFNHPCFSQFAKNHGLGSQRQQERVEPALLGHPALALHILRRGVDELASPLGCTRHVNAADAQCGHDGKEEPRIEASTADFSSQRLGGHLHPVSLIKQLGEPPVRELVRQDGVLHHPLGIPLPRLLELGCCRHAFLPLWTAGPHEPAPFHNPLAAIPARCSTAQLTGWLGPKASILSPYCRYSIYRQACPSSRYSPSAWGRSSSPKHKRCKGHR